AERVRGRDFGSDCPTTGPDLGRNGCRTAQATDKNQPQLALAFSRPTQHHSQKKPCKQSNGSEQMWRECAAGGYESKVCLILPVWCSSTAFAGLSRNRERHCATCRNIRRTSIPSRCLTANSRHSCARWQREPFQALTERSALSSRSSVLKNVPTISGATKHFDKLREKSGRLSAYGLAAERTRAGLKSREAQRRAPKSFGRK